MKRIAIFVEGLTEQILVRRMLESVMKKRNIAIQIQGNAWLYIRFIRTVLFHFFLSLKYINLIENVSAKIKLSGERRKDN